MGFTTTNPEITIKSKKRQKNFMDYAIWIDLPINVALLTLFTITIRNAFQMGLDAALETGFGITIGTDFWGILLIFGIPVLGFITLLSFATEVIYLGIKIRKKQPFITEKYAIVFIIYKIICLIILITGALIY